MNEPRFIELLNLYVDQQLSPQEAAELESEIQGNPARRRTYQQYCRMQKACAQLFEHERTSAPASTALAQAMAAADRKIIAFPERETRRTLWPIGFSVAAVAAAACVAFVVVLKTSPGGANGTASTANEVAATQRMHESSVAAVSTVMAEATKPDVALAANDDLKRVFTVQPLVSAADKSEGLFITAAKDSRLLDWTRDVQLKPLRKVSVEEFVFDGRAKPEKAVATQLSTGSEESAQEAAAFTFTK
jgi:anti-sigma factor RsiW